MNLDKTEINQMKISLLNLVYSINLEAFQKNI